MSQSSVLFSLFVNPNPSSFLFFRDNHICWGNYSKSPLEGPSWERHPIQFLVLDLSLVTEVDYVPWRGLHWSFVASWQTCRLGKHYGAWRFLVCGDGTLWSLQWCYRMWVLIVACRRKNNQHILGMLGMENTYLRAWFRSRRNRDSTKELFAENRNIFNIFQ